MKKIINKIKETIKSVIYKIINSIKLEMNRDDNKISPTFLFAMRGTFMLAIIMFVVYEVYWFLDRGIKYLLIANGMLLGGALIVGCALTIVYLYIKKISSSIILYLLVPVALFLVIFDTSKAEIGSYIAVVSFLVLFLSIFYKVALIYYKFKNKKAVYRSKTIKFMQSILFIVSLILVIYIVYIPGITKEITTNSFETMIESKIVLEDYNSKNYETIKGIYGTQQYLDNFEFENEELSYNVGISYLLNSWNQTREKYLGYNVSKIPLNAFYYMPKEEGKYPLVVIVHGNHEMSKISEVGYNYLGEYLSSNGYIVISVDENALNYSMYDNKLMSSSIGNENDARAYILLKHIDKLIENNNNSKSIFYNKVDKDNIALIGHSRGGEAVAIASLFNTINHLPNNSRLKLDFNFNIKSIIAIAPTDRQYKPGGRDLSIENVNYLLLHGSHDMDVYYMAGSNQYERIKYTNDEKYFKSMVYIYGANHGQFNETWTRTDTSLFSGLLHNKNLLLKREDQENAAKEIIYSFLEATLKDKKEYEEVFRNLKSISEYLPETLYLTQYHSSKDTIIVDYNEDIFLETTTIENGFIESKNLANWKEGASYLEGKFSNIYGAILKWDNYNLSNVPEYIINVEDTNLELLKEDIVFFSIADLTEKGIGLINLSIKLTDKEEVYSIVSLDNYSLLQNKIEIQLSKFEFFEEEKSIETVFQTFELPIELFVNNSNLDINNIKSISLVFNETKKGRIILKDLGIRHTD